MKKPTRRIQILERITRPLRRRKYNKNRDAIILSKAKHEYDGSRLDLRWNPLEDDGCCGIPVRSEVPPKWNDEEQKVKFFEEQEKPSKITEFLRRAKKDLTKKKMVNPNNNFLDMRYNPLAMDEDICIFGPITPHPAMCNDEEALETLENHKLDARYNPLANDEDFFIAVRAA